MVTQYPRVRRAFVDGSYGQLHLRRCGAATNKTPLMCLHMSPKSGRLYHRFIQSTGASRLSLAPDYPGYGESDLPPEEPHVRVEDYAREMLLVAEAEGLETLDVMGFHTGSMVAAEMARQAPDRVRKAVMVSAPLFTDAELARAEATYSHIPLDKAGTRFTTMWGRVVHHAGPGMTLEMMANSFAENLRPGEAYEWGHRAAFAYAKTYEQVLAELALPILILNPKDDLWDRTPRAAALLRHGRIVDCPDWGHGFLDVFADEAASLVCAFLDEN